MAAGIDLYDGHNWVRVNSGNVRLWDGGKWTGGQMRIWDGHNWINGLESWHQNTWEATWIQSYWSWGAKKDWRALVRPDRPTQGNYQPYHDQWDWGDEWGLIGFDDNSVRNELRGSRISKVEVYLHSLHWMYYNGGTAVVGTHNSSSVPNTAYESNHGVATAKYYQREQGQWITLPNWVGNNFRDGNLRGITVHAGTTNSAYYGYFAGMGDGWKKPKIRISYMK